MIVELSPEQMYRCHEEAVVRAEHYIQATNRKNMKDGLTFEQVIGYNVDGCMAELACSIGLNYDWSGAEGADEFDVGGWIEVRCTRYRNGKLIVKETEMSKRRPETPYVLAIISGSAVRLAGWMHLTDIVEQGYHYFQKDIRFMAVEQKHLHDIRVLHSDWTES